MGSPLCAATAARTAAAGSLPSCAGQAIHLWPVASMAPVSWTQMWPLSAETTASYGRRKAAIAVALVCVPPMRKWTSASGRQAASRTRARARSQRAAGE